VKNSGQNDDITPDSMSVLSVLALSLIERTSYPLITFRERFGRHIGLFACFNMRIALADHLLGVIEIAGGGCIPELSNQDLAHPTATTVEGEIPMPVVKLNACIRTEAFHARTRCVSGDRWWRPESILTTDQEVALVVVTDVLDRCLIIALFGEVVTDELAECRIVKRREHRPLVSRWIENALVHPEGVDDRRGDRRLVPLLFFAEDGQRLRVEIDITPPETRAALVVGHAEDLGSTHGGIGEEIDEGAVTTRSNRSVDAPVSVVCALAAGVDRGMGLLVHVTCDSVSVFGTPDLLIIGAPSIVIGQRGLVTLVFA
jgi:hypothetical protein